MKKKHNEGFSLVEVLISVIVLAAMVIPTCTALVLAVKMNDESDVLIREQLAVSSVVEQLMAEGISEDDFENGRYIRLFPGVEVSVNAVPGKTYFEVTVESTVEEAVTVTTYIRKGGDTTS